ncbi:hypothetical protein QQS21_009616 [Conoideocrella luteorostrata]|uniref:ARB-07466-like C-terminal domain-containing protein n=1 Tax=Conoideocrella luteorostrata TaxID=1105319 RepID=A0AAJ0CL12_9HYPO|nr:hypothetical protein QQS21_009616 [Conoideocrella luteorostrata]
MLLHLLHLLAATALAAPNEPCYGPSSQAGVCTTDASCSKAGGTSISGACPADPASIKCCLKPKCSFGADGRGNCRWQSDCAGQSSPNPLCPGPNQMKCCDNTAVGFGGYKAPAIPAVGACKASAVAGAKKVVAAFPGRVREIGCVRNCKCPGSSDHCCGLAIDFMCSDGGGVPTLSGKEIAEWVMRNRSALKLKYVIWGQKIWHPITDKTEKAWTSWRTMENRGDVTQNHWDHVHVSFNA